MKASGDKPSGRKEGPDLSAPAEAGRSDREMLDLDRRRKALDDAMRQHDKAKPVERPGTSDQAGFAQAMRLSTEFVAGVLVGAGIGYLVDRTAGTAPWGMIVFLLLGFGAGVMNVLRSAGMVAEPEGRMPDGKRPDKDTKARGPATKE